LIYKFFGRYFPISAIDLSLIDIIILLIVVVSKIDAD